MGAVPDCRFLTARDGALLRHALWRPAGDPRGAVILLPGRAEFAEKYAEVAGALTARGWSVRLLEWRGQGLSHRALANPQAMWVDDFATHRRDLVHWIDTVVRVEEPGRSRVVVAHSMGATIAILALDQRPDLARRAAFSAPMLGLLPERPVRVIRCLARLHVRLGLGRRYAWGERDFSVHRRRFDGNALTGHRARFALQSDWYRLWPAFAVGGVTWGWLESAFRAMDLAGPLLRRRHLPTLVFLGSEDRLVDNRLILAAAMGAPSVRLTPIAGARHELLMERDGIRRLVIDGVLRWIEPAAEAGCG